MYLKIKDKHGNLVTVIKMNVMLTQSLLKVIVFYMYSPAH